MRKVNLNKSFEEKNGKYNVRYTAYNDINMYVASNEFHYSEYKEDMRVDVVMTTENGIVSDLDVRVNVINVKKVSKRRELIAFNLKYNYIISYIEKVKERHNNVLDISFIREVIDFILNCDNFSNTKRYEVIIEDEVETTEEVNVDEANVVEANVIVDEAKVVEDVKNIKEELRMKGFNRGFKIEVNGLSKSYNIETEEIVTAFGYTDIVCKMEATSTVIIDGEYAVIKAYVEVYDGVVTHIHIGRDNNHLQLESFLSAMNANNVSNVDNLISDIKYEVSSYIGEKDINFAYSILAMVLNLNSYDSETCLYNEETYCLAQIA